MQNCHILRVDTNEIFRFTQDKKIVTCGRGLKNDIIITEISVSRSHCKFEHDFEKNKTTVIDLKSSNGIWINDLPIKPEVEAKLRDDDIIHVGNIDNERCILKYIELDECDKSVDDSGNYEIPRKAARKFRHQSITNALQNEKDKKKEDVKYISEVRNGQANFSRPGSSNENVTINMSSKNERTHKSTKKETKETKAINLETTTKPVIVLIENLKRNEIDLYRSKNTATKSKVESGKGSEKILERSEVTLKHVNPEPEEVPEIMDWSHHSDSPFEFSQNDYVEILDDSAEKSKSQLFNNDDNIKPEPAEEDSEEEIDVVNFSDSIVIGQPEEDLVKQEEEDGIINISSDEDDLEETTNRWKMRLSQNQDFIIKSEPVEQDVFEVEDVDRDEDVKSSEDDMFREEEGGKEANDLQLKEKSSSKENQRIREKDERRREDNREEKQRKDEKTKKDRDERLKKKEQSSRDDKERRTEKDRSKKDESTKDRSRSRPRSRDRRPEKVDVKKADSSRLKVDKVDDKLRSSKSKERDERNKNQNNRSRSKARTTSDCRIGSDKTSKRRSEERSEKDKDRSYRSKSKLNEISERKSRDIQVPGPSNQLRQGRSLSLSRLKAEAKPVLPNVRKNKLSLSREELTPSTMNGSNKTIHLKELKVSLAKLDLKVAPPPPSRCKLIKPLHMKKKGSTMVPTKKLHSLVDELTREEKNKIRRERLKEIVPEKKETEKPEIKLLVRPKVKVCSKSRNELLSESMNVSADTCREEQPVKKKPEVVMSSYTIPFKKPSNSKDTTEPEVDKVKKHQVLTNDSPLPSIPKREPMINRVNGTVVPILKKRKDKPDNTLKKRVSFSSDVVERPQINGLTSFQEKVRGYKSKRNVKAASNKVQDTSRLLKKDKMEEFLLDIYRWNPIWLEEQKKMEKGMDPPINETNDLTPLLHSYSSYDDYYKIMKPILRLEIWHKLVKEFEASNKREVKCSIHSIEEKTLMNATHRYTSLVVEVVVNRRDFERQFHSNLGDLICLQYQTVGRRCFIFGYIDTMHKTELHNLPASSSYNRELESFVNQPYALITYKVHTKPLTTVPEINGVERMRTVTYLRSLMKDIQALQFLPQSPLFKIILSPSAENYQLDSSVPLTNNQLLSSNYLNDKQKEAVIKATNIYKKRQDKICLIQGPPGTGKSEVIVSIVTEIYSTGMKERSVPKILLCAPSNAAVDELALRLLGIRQQMPREQRFKMVRIGRNEAMHPSVKEISLDTFAERELKRNCFPKLDSIQAEIQHLNEQILLLQNMKKNGGAGAQLESKIKRFQEKRDYLLSRDSNEIMNLKKSPDYKHRLYHYEKEVIRNADIIACTLNSCYTNQMEQIFKNHGIPICIVDEATQCSEVETLIPLMLGVRCLILVGDSNQLPATVISKRAKSLGLDNSLFTRIQSAFQTSSSNPVITLTMQYRMVNDVLQWPNAYFYNNILTSSPTIGYSLSIRPYMIFNLNSKQDENKFSNNGEAEFVTNLVLAITESVRIDKSVTMGIITPYNDQKTLIVKQIKDISHRLEAVTRNKCLIDVNTVDGFQGQERDIIIMSCVRSEGIGFLSDRQRLCVALTRAKYCLYICGNFQTFRRDLMWQALLDDADNRKLFINTPAVAHHSKIQTFINY